MNKNELKKILEKIQNKDLSIDDALNKMDLSPFDELKDSVIDNHRSLRSGHSEVIYCENKTKEQVKEIVDHMVKRNESNILLTRVNDEIYEYIKEYDTDYNKMARTIVINKKLLEKTKTKILILSAGTSDLPVVEEAYVTAEIMGNTVEKICDVGVAGLHRILSKLDKLKEASVIIVVAGFEGALASVVGGLVDVPVIAVPTSVGYGANLGGITTLLAMLTSCASGVTVVNIDNGFGAAYSASLINKKMRGN